MAELDDLAGPLDDYYLYHAGRAAAASRLRVTS